ncbi:serine hydrolase [Sphingosinicella rhizophila]|uniref:Serine hydrolase n=1 Tax=Sphingosinicella rhizophila TaxID=3050082 RepID=A0ABU3QC73_9SPHN|nr:serine hydrolase [Sphingosinicella sp. GR2756]MDT9600993.1 serine hydrolase [Sphingosinicella sp. GR2756]
MTISFAESIATEIDDISRISRIPGAAIAIVRDGAIIFSSGFGYRDREAKLPMSANTSYPIASTTKALNATLIGTLVDEGLLAWDEPVQSYFPGFRLQDVAASAQVTLRDLIIMRTGLPRHDWAWLANPSSRKDLAEAIRFLDPSAQFRDRFQYNNLTVTVAGHVAEVVTGLPWEILLRDRILEPLAMAATSFSSPSDREASLGYHENRCRELIQSQRLDTDVTAPSGGAVHSTVNDMARWLCFNLEGSRRSDGPIISATTLAEIHTPRIFTGTDPSAPTPNAGYAMGWFVDRYQSRRRLSHGGNTHDVNSEVTLFPDERIGIVSFTNFGGLGLARLINQRAFDLLNHLDPVETLAERMAKYDLAVEALDRRDRGLKKIEGTCPSHSIAEYAGRYLHPGYGEIELLVQDEGLLLRRGALRLPMRHWHFNAWVVCDNDLFPRHLPNPFDAASRFLFEIDEDGAVCALRVSLEPATAPVRFTKATKS